MCNIEDKHSIEFRLHKFCCQSTFTFSNSLTGVDITSREEQDDNHSIASSSLSNSSTVTAPTSPTITESQSPNSHAYKTESPSPENKGSSESQELYQQENVLNPEQEVLQTHQIKSGSAQIQNTDKHETQVSEENVIRVQKQQALPARFHFSRNFQTDQFTEDEDIVFEPHKKKNRKLTTEREKIVDKEKHDVGNDSSEADFPVHIGDHVHKRPEENKQDESQEQLHNEKSYEGNYITYEIFITYL